MESLQVENVVASTAINQELDLERVARDLDGVQFDPDRFPGAVYRMEEPKAVALVFRSGNIVVTGAESRDDIETAVHRTVDVLCGLGLDIPDEPAYTVQNMVVSGSLGHQLDLNAAAIGLGLDHIEYEPEQFPGLVYRVDETGTVTLLFGSGKFIITGGTQVSDAEQTLELVVSQLDELGLREAS